MPEYTNQTILDALKQSPSGMTNEDVLKRMGHMLGAIKGATYDPVKQLMQHGYSPGTEDIQGVQNSTNVAGMFTGGGLGGAGTRPGLGVGGGSLPPKGYVPFRDPKEVEYFKQLVKDKTSPDEIARVMTAHYTPPGVNVTKDQVLKAMSGLGVKSSDLPSSPWTANWTPAIQKELEQVIKTTLPKDQIKTLRSIIDTKYPGANITDPTLEHRVYKTRNVSENRILPEDEKVNYSNLETPQTLASPRLQGLSSAGNENAALNPFDKLKNDSILQSKGQLLTDEEMNALKEHLRVKDTEIINNPAGHRSKDETKKLHDQIDEMVKKLKNPKMPLD